MCRHCVEKNGMQQPNCDGKECTMNVETMNLRRFTSRFKEYFAIQNSEVNIMMALKFY